jgi:hypothetical protein
MTFSNDDIHKAIDELDIKIQLLKSKYPKYPFKASLLKFGKWDLAKWLLAEIERKTTNEYNEIVMNKILEWLHRINEFLKNKNTKKKVTNPEHKKD